MHLFQFTFLPNELTNVDGNIMIGLLLLAAGMLFAIPAIMIGVRPEPPVDGYYSNLKRIPGTRTVTTM